MYENGRAVKKDIDEASKLYEKAERNDICFRAFYSLGWMYEYGLGVNADYHKAIALYQKAADFLYGPAIRNLQEFNASK